MNYNKLCINCMREKDEKLRVCPYCKFDEGAYIRPPYILPPHTLLNGRYVTGRKLGAGGFGITYLALDLTLSRKVAIKEFFLGQRMYRNTTDSLKVTVSVSSYNEQQAYEINKSKFEQEARTLAQLNNLPGIVRVFDFFRENNTSYMVLEYLPGMTLKQYVKQKGGRLPFREVFGRLRPVMNSLELLHNTNLVPITGSRAVSQYGGEEQRGKALSKKSGIIHRDISPDNIMVSPSGRLTLFDFGGARIQNSDKSRIVFTKKGYTPWEQMHSREVGPWSDVYSMAATIYYCLCGRPPENVEDRIAQSQFSQKDSLVKPSSMHAAISDRQEEVLLKGLAIQYKERFQTMGEFRRALEKATPVLSPGSSTSKIVPVALSFLAILAVCAAGIVFWPGSRRDSEPVQESVQVEEKARAEDIVGQYNVGKLTYGEAAAQMENSDLPKEGMEQLERLKQSKEAYRQGEEYAQDDGMEKFALECFGKVVEDDVNYGDAQTMIEKIKDRQDAALPSADPGEPVQNDDGTMTFEGHRYYAFNMDEFGISKYSEAERFCEAMRGHLAVIGSGEENQAVYQYLRGKGLEMAHIGYSDEGQEGVWRWVTGEENTYTNWVAGQPNNGASNDNRADENYAHFTVDPDGGWNDAPFGTNTVYFICEWEMEDIGELEEISRSAAKAVASQYADSPPGEDQVLSFECHRYALYSLDRWELEEYGEAERFCEEMGGHLAVIGSEEENQAVYRFLLEHNMDMAYFGYSDEEQEGSWRWVTGEEGGYVNWVDGQPNNGASNQNGAVENYAHFTSDGDGKWNDAPFGANTPNFVCEWDSQAGF